MSAKQYYVDPDATIADLRQQVAALEAERDRLQQYNDAVEDENTKLREERDKLREFVTAFRAHEAAPSENEHWRTRDAMMGKLAALD